jgi:hypothetical protein
VIINDLRAQSTNGFAGAAPWFNIGGTFGLYKDKLESRTEPCALVGI